jgi:hypothetical protein
MKLIGKPRLSRLAAAHSARSACGRATGLLLPRSGRAGGETEAVMDIVLDDQIAWDGSILHLRAKRGSERIRCRAGRETIAALPGFAQASSLEIGERRAEAAELLRPIIAHKIEIGGYDHGPIKTISIFPYDLLRR